MNLVLRGREIEEDFCKFFREGTEKVRQSCEGENKKHNLPQIFPTFPHCF